jgi:hypothetical protein
LGSPPRPAPIVYAGINEWMLAITAIRTMAAIRQYSMRLTVSISVFQQKADKIKSESVSKLVAEQLHPRQIRRVLVSLVGQTGPNIDVLVESEPAPITDIPTADTDSGISRMSRCHGGILPDRVRRLTARPFSFTVANRDSP